MSCSCLSDTNAVEQHIDLALLVRCQHSNFDKSQNASLLISYLASTASIVSLMESSNFDCFDGSTVAPTHSSSNRSRPPSNMGSSYVTSSTFQSSTWASKTNITSPFSCYSCGSRFHTAKHCDQPKPKRCFNCGDTGHFRRDCRVPESGHAIQSSSYEGDAAIPQSWLGHSSTPKSIFERELGEADYAHLVKEYKAKQPEAPDLIGFNSSPSKSEPSTDEYNPAKYNLPRSTRLDGYKTLYSGVVQGGPVDCHDLYSEENLLDRVDDEQKPDVTVTLQRKRKGRKGRSSTYDLTPLLSY